MRTAPAPPAASPLHRLQAIDRSQIGGSGLYLASNRPALAAAAEPSWLLYPGDWLGSGTFRNSFFAEPWARWTHVRELCLVLSLRGRFRLRVMQGSLGAPVRVLRELAIDQPEPGEVVVEVGTLQGLPAGSRLFWHLEAVEAGQLRQVGWCTRTPPAAAARPEVPALAVLIRTHGRGADVRALLRRWIDEARPDTHLHGTLRRLALRVLDSTADAAADWPDPALAGLDLRVWQAPNLGGGGNAAHLAQLFLDEADASGLEPPELLILDDDLAISLESIARHVAHCDWRREDSVSSLPVLMKSRPTTVWEDGGLWGVEALPDSPTPPRRGLAPTLLRHGLSLDGYEHLDGFGPLQPCEYTTFIFLALPTRCLRKLGLPAAFFLRGDDIEFCLRARAAGLAVWTNPNLAAWHEPGHGPGQEYMAVLHAVLINLAHSSNTADDYVGFFEQRMVEHAALGDLGGLSLYLAVLHALLAEDSPVLGEHFEQHYLRMLPRWAGLAGQPLGEAQRQRLAHARTDEALLRPFAYPGYHPSTGRRVRDVWLQVPTSGTARKLSPTTATQRLALQQEMLGALQQWVAGFDTLQRRWRERLASTGTPDFWRRVRAHHASATRCLVDAPAPDRAGQAGLPPATPPAWLAAQPPQALGDLRDALECELAQWKRLRARAEGWHGGRGLRDWWRGWRRRPGSAAGGPGLTAELPVDWDPAQYLALNLDVARSGVDPAQHYLRFGRTEGRRYRA